jgi:plasmid stabilization system protein ParE
MALKVSWSKEAREDLIKAIAYLEENWTEKEIRKFTSKLEEQINIISLQPKTYKKSKRLLGTYECLVTKHNSLFYTYNETSLFIVTVWYNRQEPVRLQRSGL